MGNRLFAWVFILSCSFLSGFSYAGGGECGALSLFNDTFCAIDVSHQEFCSMRPETLPCKNIDRDTLSGKELTRMTVWHRINNHLEKMKTRDADYENCCLPDMESNFSFKHTPGCREEIRIYVEESHFDVQWNSSACLTIETCK